MRDSTSWGSICVDWFLCVECWEEEAQEYILRRQILNSLVDLRLPYKWDMPVVKRSMQSVLEEENELYEEGEI